MKIRSRINGRLRDLIFICVGPLLLVSFFVILAFRAEGQGGGGAQVQSQNLELDADNLTSGPQTSEERLLTSEPDFICNFENYVVGQPINQSDPCLVATVEKYFLVSPSPQRFRTAEHVPFKKSEEVDKPSNIEKLNWTRKLLIENSSKDAQFFFVESKVYDDDDYSSCTSRLETLFGWRGVLIEPRRLQFQRLLKERTVWAVNAALCATPLHPVDLEQKDGQRNKGRLPCIPFYTILKALNVTVVDFLNLNIEGAELEILKTIPFNDVIFNIMAIEHSRIPGKNPVGQLKYFLESKGYELAKTLNGTNESLFVYKPLYEQIWSVINTLIHS